MNSYTPERRRPTISVGDQGPDWPHWLIHLERLRQAGFAPGDARRSHSGHPALARGKVSLSGGPYTLNWPASLPTSGT